MFGLLIAWLVGGEFWQLVKVGLVVGFCGYILVDIVKAAAAGKKKRKSARPVVLPDVPEEYEEEEEEIEEEKENDEMFQTYAKYLEGYRMFCRNAYATMPEAEAEKAIANYPDYERHFCAAPSVEEEAEAEWIEEQRKRLDQLRKRYDLLLDRKARMKYIHGASDPNASEFQRSAAMAKLEKSKTWKGLLWDIDWTKRNIKEIESEVM